MSGLFDPAAFSTTPGQRSAADLADPRSVRCPTCHAEPGRSCKRPSGHQVWGGESHAARVKAADA